MDLFRQAVQMIERNFAMVKKQPVKISWQKPKGFSDNLRWLRNSRNLRKSPLQKSQEKSQK
jgi:hypothetical protein